MSGENEVGLGLKSISEVSQETGIPESTLRYYDSEFSDYLDIKRDSANRRAFGEKDTRQILYIRRLLKKDGLTVKQVKDRLAVEKDLMSTGMKAPDEGAMDQLNERLTRIERQQDLLVKAVETILQESRQVRRLLDLNLTRLSFFIDNPKGR